MRPQVIGSSFCDARELEGASLVCKGWRSGFASGVPGIELTVHRDTDQWCAMSACAPGLYAFKGHIGAGAMSPGQCQTALRCSLRGSSPHRTRRRTRIARLRQLLPGLRRCKAHVGAGVESFPGAITALAQELDMMEVRHRRHGRSSLKAAAARGTTGPRLWLTACGHWKCCTSACMQASSLLASQHTRTYTYYIYIQTYTHSHTDCAAALGAAPWRGLPGDAGDRRRVHTAQVRRTHSSLQAACP